MIPTSEQRAEWRAEAIEALGCPVSTAPLFASRIMDLVPALDAAEAERDTALARIDKVRAALAPYAARDHDEACDGDGYCGRDIAEEALRALDGEVEACPREGYRPGVHFVLRVPPRDRMGQATHRSLHPTHAEALREALRVVGLAPKEDR